MNLIPVLMLSDSLPTSFLMTALKKAWSCDFLRVGFFFYFQDAKGGKEDNQSRLSACQLWAFREKSAEAMTFPVDFMPTPVQQEINMVPLKSVV